MPLPRSNIRPLRIAGLLRSFMVIVVVFACLLALTPALRGQETAPAPAATSSPAPATDPAAITKAATLKKSSMGEAFFIMRNPLTDSIEWVGTLIVWLLIILSIACTSLIGTLMWTHRRPDYVPDDLVKSLKTAFYDKRTDQAFMAIAGSKSMLAGVMAPALRQASHGYLAMVRAAEQRSDELAVQRLRSIEPLNVIGNVAPMLGLFGTVYGIILSFREIVASGGTPDPVSLAAGIGTALVATFWGLVVAIPALAFYGVLRARIDGLTVETSSVADDLLAQLKPAA